MSGHWIRSLKTDLHEELSVRSPRRSLFELSSQAFTTAVEKIDSEQKKIESKESRSIEKGDHMTGLQSISVESCQ